MKLFQIYSQKYVKFIKKFKAKRICNAFYTLHLMSKYLCMTPLLEPNNKTLTFKDSIKSVVSSAIFLLSFIISTSMLIFDQRQIPEKYVQDAIILVTTGMQIISGIISVGAVMWMRFVQKRIVNDFYQTAYKIDCDLEKLNIFMCNNQLKLLVNFLVVLGNSAVLGTLFLHFRGLYVDTGKIYWFMIISIGYPFELLNVHTFRYICGSFLLFKRFGNLNDYLKSVLQKMETRRKESNEKTIGIIMNIKMILYKQRILLVNIHGVTDTVTMLMIFILIVFNLYYICSIHIVLNNDELYNHTAIIWWLIYSQIIIILVLWTSKQFTEEVRTEQY